VTNDQIAAAAAGGVGHEDHLKNPLNSSVMNSPSEEWITKVQYTSAAAETLANRAQIIGREKRRRHFRGFKILSLMNLISLLTCVGWLITFRRASLTRYQSKGRNGRRMSTSCSLNPCSSMAAPGDVYKVSASARSLFLSFFLSIMVSARCLSAYHLVQGRLYVR
jgi:hypothetical protein